MRHGGQAVSWAPPSTPLPSQVMRQGTDLTLVSFGKMVGFCLKAAEALEKEGVSCEASRPQRAAQPRRLASLTDAPRHRPASRHAQLIPPLAVRRSSTCAR